MIELIEFVLGSFWRFVGFITMMYCVLFFFVNGIIRVTNIVFKYKSKKQKHD